MNNFRWVALVSHVVSVIVVIVVVALWYKRRPVKNKKTRKVLIVDDNVVAADSLKLFLENSGYEVRVAYDGEQAIREATAANPDVVILDIDLPKIDGCKVAKVLRRQKKLKDAQLIAMTGCGSCEDKQEAAAAGFDVYVTKPVEPSDIRKLLDENT